MITLEGLVHLIDGELLNSPFISQIIGYGDIASKIKRGSMFIVRDRDDIPLAIKNGAYAILSDKYLSITDKEIAWIKVESIETALLKILKYESLNYSLNYVDSVTFDIIKSMNREKNVILLKGDLISKIIKALNHISKEIISDDEDIKNNFLNIKELDEMELLVTKKSLFKTTFFMNGKNYIVNLPSIYIKEFSKSLNLFLTKEYNYSLNDIKIDRFKISYVSNNLNLMENGASSKVIIQGLKNDDRFFSELNFIIKYAHSKIVFINSTNLELLKSNFNFAFLVDTEIELKAKERQEVGLF